MTSMNNEQRRGRFTSSMVYKLIPYGSVKMTTTELAAYKKANPKSRKTTRPGGFQKPGLTYIQEKQIERRLKSCIDGGAHTQVLAWGNFMELTVYSVLGWDYKISSKETNLHPKYGDFWAGSKDVYTEDPKTGKMLSIGEIKCFQKKNHALYADCLMQKDIDLFKNEFPKEYWQIVSNAIINEVPIGEAIAYMPYVSEAEIIKEMAYDYDGEDQWKYKFIQDLPVEDLPFLPNDGYYKNITKFGFIIPEEDIELLESRILEAYELLNQKNLIKT